MGYLDYLIPKKNSLVIKSNRINEVRPLELKLQELRFLSIYLSQINPMDINSRLVRFPASDFQVVMELGRLNMAHLQKATDGLLTKLTGIPDETGRGIIRFQLFKECRISQDENDEWFVEIDAHDRALPLMFDLKSHYFKYELWNTLYLKSQNQMRMYEILKQHEKIGHRIVAVSELRELLGVKSDEYSKYNDFKVRVLEPCRKALSEKTDIFFTYKAHKRGGKGGKILELKFTITKNDNYKNPINLERFMGIVPRDKNSGSGTKNIKKTKSSSGEVAENAQLVTDTNLTKDEHMANFEQFWQSYPENKRVGRKTAMQEWFDLPHSQAVFVEIMEGLESAKKSEKWSNEGGKYAHEPTGWLKGERWLDRYKKAPDMSKNKRNFKNYKGHKWDYEKMQEMEEELLAKKIAQA